MTDSDSPGLSPLPLDQARQLDRLCNRLEAAWKNGERPRLEDFAREVEEADRAVVLRELVLLEVACRKRLGETPEPKEYTARFPELNGAWLRKEMAGSPTISDSEARSHSSSDDDTFSNRIKPVDLTRFLAPARQADELGRLGGFRILKVLGQGGMGAVYLAEDPRLRRKVALKVMLPELASSENSRQRFMREAQAAASLEHDNIVPILQINEDAGIPYIVMPFLKGMPLSDHLVKDEPLPIAEILKIGRETAEALAAAHGHGLIHRDIKPGNIWLESRDESGVRSADSLRTASDLAAGFRVKLLDFGLAHLAVVDETEHLTRTGALLGTPGWMSPEQVDGGDLDGRSDLFSLGCVLYRLATGRAAFAGTTLTDKIVALATGNPAPPHQLNPKVPIAMSQLIQELLAKKRDDRPASASLVAVRLAGIERALLPESPAEPTVKIPDPPVPSSPRKRRPILVAALLLLGLLLVVGFGAYGVIRIANEQGDYVIDTDDPDFAFSVSKGTVTLEDRKTKRTYNLKVVRQDKGEYELEVTDAGDGLFFKTKTFTIRRGQQVALKAWFERRQADNKPPAIEVKKQDLAWKPIPVGQSPFDKLDANEIPKAERFDWQPKELVAVIGGHARRHWGWVNAIAISPDGKLAASHAVSRLGSLIIWDTAKQEEKWRFNTWERSFITSLAFSRNGKKLYCLFGGFLKVVDLSEEKPNVKEFELPEKDQERNGHWHFCSLCENDRTLIVRGVDEKIALFNVSGDKPNLVSTQSYAKPMLHHIPSIVVASDANQVIYLAVEGKLRRATIKDSRFGKDEELPIKLGEKEFPRAVTPDGKILALWDVDHLKLFDLTQNPPTHKRIKSDNEQIRGDSAYQFSPDGRWLAARYTYAALFRVDGPEPSFVTWLDQTSIGSFGGVAFSSDNNKAVAGNFEGFVRFWNLGGPAPKEMSPFDPATGFINPPHRVRSNPLDSQVGRLLVPRYDDLGLHRYQLWDFKGTKPEPHPLKEFFDPEIYQHIHITGANRCFGLSVTGDVPSRQYELSDGRWQPTGKPNTDLAGLGNVSPDRKTLIAYAGPANAPSTQLDGWDVSMNPPKRKWTRSLKAHPSIPHDFRKVWFSADCRWFATQAQGPKDEPWNLVLWQNNRLEPAVHATIPIKTIPDYYLAAFSPDGRYLCHFKDWTKGEVLALEDISGREPREVANFSGGINYQLGGWLAFHPDSKKLVVGNGSGVSVLEIPSGKVLWKWEAPGAVDWAEFAADGRHLVIHNANKTIYVLRLAF